MHTICRAAVKQLRSNSHILFMLRNWAQSTSCYYRAFMLSLIYYCLTGSQQLKLQVSESWANIFQLWGSCWSIVPFSNSWARKKTYWLPRHTVILQVHSGSENNRSSSFPHGFCLFMPLHTFHFTCKCSSSLPLLQIRYY